MPSSPLLYVSVPCGVSCKQDRLSQYPRDGYQIDGGRGWGTQVIEPFKDADIGFRDFHVISIAICIYLVNSPIV